MNSVTPHDLRALIAIDLGAESCRVSLLRWLAGGPHIQLVHRFQNNAVERDLPNGERQLHWNIEFILAELHRGLVLAAEIATEGIRSIAVDGWAVDYVRLNAEGAAIAPPFCYRDERTIATELAVHRLISAERMREITGQQLMRINTLYQMAADPPKLAATRWLNLPEYVLFHFGGRPVSELTNASHTQMIALDGRWSSEIFAALGWSLESAPELVPPGTDIGQVTGDLAVLPAFANTRLIAPACHDTASAIAAIPDGGDDWAYISSGTWSLVGTVLRTPINNAEAKAENYTNLGGVDGTVCFHKNVNGMWLLRQCMDSWSHAGGSLALPTLIEAAAAFGPRDFVLDVDDPDLLLPGNMPQRINAQLRRRGLPEFIEEPENADALASFIFHSLAARYAAVLAKVAAISGKHFRKLYIMGGGSQNQLLNRLTAEATGLEVVRAGTECSTIGNFAVQLATLESAGNYRRHHWAERLAGAL